MPTSLFSAPTIDAGKTAGVSWRAACHAKLCRSQCWHVDACGERIRGQVRAEIEQQVPRQLPCADLPLSPQLEDEVPLVVTMGYETSSCKSSAMPGSFQPAEESGTREVDLHS
jgi:hypothetical protein